MTRWFLILLLLASCSPLSLGRPFKVHPGVALKPGHDRTEDVLRKMGPPYRHAVDGRGRVLFTYLWADGEGGGEKCVVAFNENGVVSLVELSP